jgi:D-sedoheptulose 7-phosphate isomerase
MISENSGSVVAIPVEDILVELLSRFPVLFCCAGDIRAAFAAIAGCFGAGGKLLVCGNGGSAADADHMCAELLKGFRRPRTLDGTHSDLSRELVENLQGALPAIPLPNFTASLTAFSNDCRPEFSFAQLVLALGKEGDGLFGISTSGNSKNVLLAMDTARALGMKTIGLSGASGGKMVGICDVCICVPETETYRIQELHLPIYHALCSMLEVHFF